MIVTKPEIILVLEKKAREHGWTTWPGILRAIQEYQRTGRMPWAR